MAGAGAAAAAGTVGKGELRMRSRWTWLLALVPVVALASGDFAWQWPLQLSAPAASAYRVPLDAAVYRAAWWPDLRDVRVLDADGQPMPSQVQAAEALPAQVRQVELAWFLLPASAGAGAGDDLSVVVQRSSDGQMLSIRNASPGGRVSAGGGATLLVDLGDHAGRVRALRMDWDAAAGSVDVGYRVDGSNDLRQWAVLDPDARVVALRNAGHELRNDRLPLASRFRYVRLTPLQRVAAPTLRGVRGEIAEDRDASDWQWLDVSAATPADATQRGYRYRVDGRFPIQRLRLALPVNSSARWRVWNRDDADGDAADATGWRQVAARWNTWRLHAGNTDESSPPLELPTASSAHAWRLQAIAGSGTQAPVLQLGYRPGAIVFLAQGRAPYRLVAGRADAAAAADVMQPVLAALRERHGAEWQPPVALLGARTALAGEAAYRPAPRDWKAWILWAVLALGAATVALFALRLLRAERPPDAG